MQFAVADIHGCIKTFRKLLERSGLTRHDTLYLLGDYIDRGPDSRGVLAQIMALIEGGYDIRPLRGNHEEMMLRTYRQQHDELSWCWVHEWGNATTRSFSVCDLAAIPVCYWNFMEALPLYEQTEQHVFVHGCFDHEVTRPLQDTSPFFMLWGNTRHHNGINGKQVVSGHVSTPLQQIRESFATGHILLDNGCCLNYEPGLGNLVMLNLNTMELLLQPLIDEIGLAACSP